MDPLSDPDLPAAPELAIQVIDDLEQLRALSDPLRLRILEALCGPPRTTKQVADRLGEKPTRLYHHVDALEAAGLLRLVHTRPKRGTLEKYYQSVARQFRTDPSIFPRSTEAGSEDSWQQLGARLLEGAASDLRRLAGRGDEDAYDGDEERLQAMIARLKVRASERSLRSIHERLEALLVELSQESDTSAAPRDQADGEVKGFDLVLAFYPEVDP